MKKEINELLSSENATLRLNKFCTLYRWQVNALGERVDFLRAEFSVTHQYSHSYAVTARSWQKIIEEIQLLQSKAFADAANQLNTQLKNGYFS